MCLESSLSFVSWFTTGAFVTVWLRLAFSLIFVLSVGLPLLLGRMVSELSVFLACEPRTLREHAVLTVLDLSMKMAGQGD